MQKRLQRIEDRIYEIAKNSVGKDTIKSFRILQRDVENIKADIDVLRDTGDELEDKIKIIESRLNNECKSGNSRTLPVVQLHGGQVFGKHYESSAEHQR